MGFSTPHLFKHRVDQTVSRVITGARPVVWFGPAALILASANTYNGQTRVQGGSVTFQGNNTATGILIGSSGSVGATFRAALGTTSLRAVTTVAGSTGNVFEYANTGATSLTITNALTLNAPLIVRKTSSANIATITFAGVMTGGTAGQDTLIFSNLGGSRFLLNPGIATRNYLGRLRFLTANGSDYAVNGSVFSAVNPIVLDAGATLRSNITGTAIFDYLEGAGSWNTTRAVNVTLSIGNNNGSGVHTGVIANSTGSIGIIKNGTGTQTFSGANTYSGTTAVNGGILRISGASSLGTGAVSVNNGGTLTCTVNMTGLRTVTVNAGGVVNKGGFAHTGTVFVNNGGTINP